MAHYQYLIAKGHTTHGTTRDCINISWASHLELDWFDTPEVSVRVSRRIRVSSSVNVSSRVWVSRRVRVSSSVRSVAG